MPREKETWWWNNEVQIAIKEKRKAYKALKDGLGNQEEYKKWNKEVKRPVVRAKERAWKEWYDNLETNEGEDKTYKIVKQRETKERHSSDDSSERQRWKRKK